MKRSISWFFVLALISSLVLAPSLFGQIKKDPKGLDSIEGTVQSIDQKTMTITVRERGTSNLDYKVVYNDKTEYTYHNAKSTFSEVKEGRRVVCLGKAEGTNKLNAARIEIRDK